MMLVAGTALAVVLAAGGYFGWRTFGHEDAPSLVPATAVQAKDVQVVTYRRGIGTMQALKVAGGARRERGGSEAGARRERGGIVPMDMAVAGAGEALRLDVGALSVAACVRHLALVTIGWRIDGGC